MAHVHRELKPANFQYGELWGRFWWICDCGKKYHTRYEAQACCKPMEAKA